MRSKLSIRRALLATSVLVSPGLGMAQETGSDEQDDIEVIVIRGSNIPDPQRNTSQVASFLSEEDLARTGDANAALALTRLSGLSIVGERFAFIRGLGDRYSNARLNGSPLPSPEPLRRTVPLDLFPSNILSGATVQKTFSADYPGEFGGGVIDLNTLSQVSQPFANLKVGTAVNTETTFRNGIFVRGSDLDFLGFDGGLRDIPGPLRDVLNSDQTLNELSDAEIETVGESLVNSPLSVIQSGDLGPDFNISADGGASFNVGDVEIGFVGVAGYDQSWETQRADRQVQANNVLGNDQRLTETTLDVTTNALGSLTVSTTNHEAKLTGLYIHSTDKEAQIVTGPDFNRTGTGLAFDESSGFFERQLGMVQLAGDSRFGDLTLDWRGAYALSERDSPYERTLQRQINSDGVVVYDTPNQYTIRFSDLEDDLFSGALEATYSVPVPGARELDISAGYEFSYNNRTYDFVQLIFGGGNNLTPFQETLRPDFLFSPDNIEPGQFVLQEFVSDFDNYNADLYIHAPYLLFDGELIPTVRTTVGVRIEDSRQRVNTFSRLGDEGPGSEINEDYVLPSLTLTWNAFEDFQVRFGFSETITRPQFRELARSIFFDPDSERTFRGNSNLLNSEIRNYDLRLEYYLGRNQFINVAGFLKTIEDPIEEVQFETSTFVFETTFINSPRARLFGGEFEYRSNFTMPFGPDWVQALDWLFSVNYTYTNSEISVRDGDVILNPLVEIPTALPVGSFDLDGAELQGASNHIFNSQFGFQGEFDQLTILLGWVSERVLQRGFGLAGGGEALPDIVEKPGVQLDVVYRRKFNLFDQNFTLGLAARNLTGADHREFQESGSVGTTQFNTYDRGRTISASLTASFF